MQPAIPPIQYFAVHRTGEISPPAAIIAGMRRIAAIFPCGGIREGGAGRDWDRSLDDPT
jgi:hypothetical protein